MRRLLLSFATALVGNTLAEPSVAQVYPARPITLIVPYAAGGSADTLPRVIAEHMRGSLGQPVIIENVTGAAGNIGTGRVARATPDGYTFGLGTWSTHVANGAVYALQYDVLKDFEPISKIASSPLLIATRKSLPATERFLQPQIISAVHAPRGRPSAPARWSGGEAKGAEG